MFKLGDLAVYPAHGVGVIEGIETKSFSGMESTFYVIRILGSGMTIMVPKKNASHIGMRNIISIDEKNTVYAILESTDATSTPIAWNKRFREYTEKIKTGSIFELAKMLRELYLLQRSKSLSFGEKKMLETARALVVKELSIVEEIAEHKVISKIDAIFNTSASEK